MAPECPENLGRLHGLTVVVDTTGSRVYVGRFDTVEDGKIRLLDAGYHDDGEEGKSREDYLRRAAEVGVWKKLEIAAIPYGEATSIRRLTEI